MWPSHLFWHHTTWLFPICARLYSGGRISHAACSPAEKASERSTSAALLPCWPQLRQLSAGLMPGIYAFAPPQDVYLGPCLCWLARNNFNAEIMFQAVGAQVSLAQLLDLHLCDPRHDMAKGHPKLPRPARFPCWCWVRARVLNLSIPAAGRFRSRWHRAGCKHNNRGSHAQTWGANPHSHRQQT